MRIISYFRSMRVAYLWMALFLQIFFLIRYINTTLDPYVFRWDELKLQQFAGDEPSYFVFPFESISSILDNYRSFGLPLIIHIYNLLSSSYQYWPHFQFSLYVASIFFLFGALLKFGFDKIFSFMLVSFLLWNIDFHTDFHWFQFYSSLFYLNTEVLCVAFIYITIAVMLLSIKYNNWKTNLAFTFVLFYLYQIRSNVSYIAVLAPFWAASFSYIQNGWRDPKVKKIFLRFILTSWVPLFLFGFFRLLVLGRFGFATMTGGTLAGHAVHYLNEKNVIKLSAENRVIGEEILRRKRKLSFPCNLSPFSYKVIPNKSDGEIEAKCFGPDLITAWQVAIKNQTGKEPFADPEKNIEPWKYTSTLASFHSKYYNTATDEILMKFSKDILILEWRQYLRWIVQGSLYGLQFILLNDGMLPFYWFCFLVAIVVQISLRSGLFGKRDYKVWQRQIFAISVISISNFTVGYILLILFNYPFERMFLTLTPFIFPALVLWAIPPVWLTRKIKSHSDPE